MAASLLTGFGVSTAFAEPGESCTGEDCAKTDPAGTTAQADAPPVMTADEALAIIARDYDLGEGGGQLSTLIHDVMTLRAQGFKPSNANKKAITEALDHRPNQAPLVEALKETLSYQRKMQARPAERGRGPAARVHLGPDPAASRGSAGPGQPEQHRHRPHSGQRHHATHRLAGVRARRKAAEHPGLPGRPRAAAC